MKRYTLLLTLLVAATGFIAAQTPWTGGRTDGESLTIKLVTVGPDDELYSWWGHAGIIVEDRRSRYSLLYDYGRFSFDQDSFYTDFAQGRLYFEVGRQRTESYLEAYKQMNRTIVIQTLDISPEERMAMALFLDNNVKRENRVYLYDHYYDNCATRLRDVIDAYTDGSVKAATQSGSGWTFREISRRYSGHHFLVDFLLMYLMGSDVDVEMTEWETMFLPDMLAKYMPMIESISQSGRKSPLVADTVVFNTAVGRRGVPERAPPLWPPALGFGGAFGIIALVGACFAGLSRSRRRARIGGAVFGSLIAVTGFISGLLGTLLFYMGFFTDHVVTYGNENLFYTNPLALALIPLGILLARGRAVKANVGALAFFVLTVVVLCFLKLVVPGLEQQNWPAMSMFASAYFLELAGALVILKAPKKTAVL